MIGLTFFSVLLLSATICTVLANAFILYHTRPQVLQNTKLAEARPLSQSGYRLFWNVVLFVTLAGVPIMIISFLRNWLVISTLLLRAPNNFEILLLVQYAFSFAIILVPAFALLRYNESIKTVNAAKMEKSRRSLDFHRESMEYRFRRRGNE